MKEVIIIRKGHFCFKFWKLHHHFVEKVNAKRRNFVNIVDTD